MNLIQQVTEELLAQTERSQQLEGQVRELRQIADALFEIAEPGPIKNSLWQKYQSVGKQKPIIEPFEGTSGM